MLTTNKILIATRSVVKMEEQENGNRPILHVV